MKHDAWLYCESCDSEYQIISSVTNDSPAAWCPFCGLENEVDEEDDFTDEDY
jgi:hypothetical protein